MIGGKILIATLSQVVNYSKIDRNIGDKEHWQSTQVLYLCIVIVNSTTRALANYIDIGTDNQLTVLPMIVWRSR